ncbi:MAG: RluA family pseudouridine synthase [Desulfobacterales bacterium]|nr:RluA family pseudouridine synthase [Desulfobacterales bacterium]
MYSVLYEDNALFIINKPQGIATSFGRQKCLCDIVFSEFPYLKEVKGYNENEGGLLNRLDNETGGIVLFAKTDDSFKHYCKMMQEEKVEKIYTAFVDGVPFEKMGVIKTPIAHHRKNRKKMIAVLNRNTRYRGIPKYAETFWELIKIKEGVSLVKIIIKKGVRHQIRVHMASVGCPVIGDKLYNKKTYHFDNHFLYASGIKLISLENKLIEINIDVPFIDLF